MWMIQFHALGIIAMTVDYLIVLFSFEVTTGAVVIIELWKSSETHKWIRLFYSNFFFFHQRRVFIREKRIHNKITETNRGVVNLKKNIL